MLLLDDDDELPDAASEAEADFAELLGEAGLAHIDAALEAEARASWSKVARVVLSALRATNRDVDDDAVIDLYARRVIALVEAGKLEAQGNLQRPRWSEVRLPHSLAGTVR